jgi:hypothetical protein
LAICSKPIFVSTLVSYLLLKDLLLITPPFTQLNTPYPATAYLKGFLNTKQISSYQIDLGIEVILRLFSKKGLKGVFDEATEIVLSQDENCKRIWSLREAYIEVIDAVILFLQNQNPTLARQICSDGFLPEAGRFNAIEEMEWAFGIMGMQDKAKHLATLFLEDISDFIVACIDQNFGFSRYAERLGRSANSFDDLHHALQQTPTYIDTLTLLLLEQKLKETQPKMVCFSVPFPGNLYSAFRCAQFIKANFQDVKVAMGGGFANTELRNLNETRVFDFFDFITLDDGELPIELLYNHICRPEERIFKRTFVKEDNQVLYINNTKKNDYKQSQVGTPDYSDLLLNQYISVIEVTNPMHSLWSDGRWNKLTLAHGCYWGKCTFCDISLDYIKIYEPLTAALVVDRMEELIAQTKETGFHFVDEAAPPALMRELALEIIKRKLTLTWWTNIRFEKSFTADLCYLLKRSGCIAVSGGLEVASDRLLDLIQKGVSVAQVAQVTRNFTETGIMVHAYLMYGYPTQTTQETIDSLEMVRQMFELGILQSGFWHQFALTAHSPIGLNPDAFGIIPDKKTITFANNDITFKDTTGINHDLFGFGLKKSLYNFMHGLGIDFPLQEWFDFKIPKTKIPNSYIEEILNGDLPARPKDSAKVFWLGGEPEPLTIEKSKNKKTKLVFHNKQESFTILVEPQMAIWLAETLQKITIFQPSVQTLKMIKDDFENRLNQDFDFFWYSKPIQTLRQNGLLHL